MQEGFEPERGDIVIYEKLLTDNSHDHIGIVLACDEESNYWLQRGNTEIKTTLAFYTEKEDIVFSDHICVDESYQFNFQGEYRPT